MSSSTKLLENEDEEKILEIDKGCHQGWNFKWLDIKYKVAVPGKGYIESRFRDCFKKLDVKGKALCIYCDETLNYGCTGKSHLIRHVDSAKHKEKCRIRESNYTLSNQFSGACQALENKVTPKVSHLFILFFSKIFLKLHIDYIYLRIYYIFGCSGI